MKAVAYRAKGEPQVLVDIDLPRPEPGPRDLLVEVRAVSVNPADVKVRRFQDPAEAEGHRVLGYDAAGIVVGVGGQVARFAVGDEVYYAGAVDRPGTNSQFHLVDERIAGRKPKTLSFAEAAAVPLTAITAWEILFDRMKVPRDGRKSTGTLLIVNGAGGVGSMLIQLASRLTGLTVIATASRPESAEWVRKLGALHVADHGKPIDQAIREIGFEGVDYMAVITSTPGSAPALARAMNPQGHIVFIDNFDESISVFKEKSITISWEMMFTRSLFQTADMDAQRELLGDVSALLDCGEIRSTLTTVVNGPIDAENLRKAHAIVEAGRTIGKVVVAQDR